MLSHTNKASGNAYFETVLSKASNDNEKDLPRVFLVDCTASKLDENAKFEINSFKKEFDGKKDEYDENYNIYTGDYSVKLSIVPDIKTNYICDWKGSIGRKKTDNTTETYSGKGKRIFSKLGRFQYSHLSGNVILKNGKRLLGVVIDIHVDGSVSVSYLDIISENEWSS